MLELGRISIWSPGDDLHLRKLAAPPTASCSANSSAGFSWKPTPR